MKSRGLSNQVFLFLIAGVSAVPEPEKSVWRRAGDQKTDRRARLEATLLEDAQLRAFHARVTTSYLIF